MSKVIRISDSVYEILKGISNDTDLSISEIASEIIIKSSKRIVIKDTFAQIAVKEIDIK